MPSRFPALPLYFPKPKPSTWSTVNIFLCTSWNLSALQPDDNACLQPANSTPLLYFVYTITSKVNATVFTVLWSPPCRIQNLLLFFCPGSSSAEMLIKYVCRMPQVKRNIQSRKKLPTRTRRHINTRGYHALNWVTNDIRTIDEAAVLLQACSWGFRGVHKFSGKV